MNEQEKLIHALKNWLLWIDMGAEILTELKSIKSEDVSALINSVEQSINICENTDDSLITEYQKHLRF